MVKRQQVRLGIGAAALLLVAGYFWMRPAAPAAPAAGGSAPAGGRRGAAKESRVPRIGLDRLTAAAPAEPSVQRDLFGFGPEPTPPPTVAPPVAANEFPTPDPNATPTPIPLPPLNVKYIGSLQTQKGLRVAFFQTEKKEIVTGQVGEVVMNRFKVVKIGYESADVQEVGAEQVRRLPLRGGS
jgi:hypothetical protein